MQCNPCFLPTNLRSAPGLHRWEEQCLATAGFQRGGRFFEDLGDGFSRIPAAPISVLPTRTRTKKKCNTTNAATGRVSTRGSPERRWFSYSLRPPTAPTSSPSSRLGEPGQRRLASTRHSCKRFMFPATWHNTASFATTAFPTRLSTGRTRLESPEIAFFPEEYAHSDYLSRCWGVPENPQKSLLVPAKGVGYTALRKGASQSRGHPSAPAADMRIPISGTPSSGQSQFQLSRHSHRLHNRIAMDVPAVTSGTEFAVRPLRLSPLTDR